MGNSEIDMESAPDLKLVSVSDFMKCPDLHPKITFKIKQKNNETILYHFTDHLDHLVSED